MATNTPHTAQIIGIPIDDMSSLALITAIMAAVAQRKHTVFANVNIHALNLAYEYPAVYDFFATAADIVYCDGFGVKLGSKMSGVPIQHRLTLPDWIDELCRQSAQNGYSLYLLGAREGVAERAAARLQRVNPNLQIAGTHHGFFNKSCDDPENRAVLQKINAVQPDILLIAFGMPLQELWLLENWNQISAHAVLTAGALFDYLAEEVRRPPNWMTDHGLEWFGRLLREPGRLWRRYLIGNPLFFWRLLKYSLAIKPAHVK